MLKQNIEKILNNQVYKEGFSSLLYLSMASWSENNGYEGIANFFYTHSEEEKTHMLRLIKYINERNGKAIIPGFELPKSDFKDLKSLFEEFYSHEVMISNEINKIVDVTLNEKDYLTHNFLQWYVSEQIEEERLAQLILEKLKLIGDDKGGLYLFDRDINQIQIKNNLSKN